MFDAKWRNRLRETLLDRARSDRRLSGGAITGSAAGGREDAWSDIDLAFGVLESERIESVLEDWTDAMYRDHSAAHHFDVPFGSWVYRVFLLANSLQVDLAFAPAAEFGPLAPTFELVFGAAQPPIADRPSNVHKIIGQAWLHALHARSCLARAKPWQAEFMISGLRNQVLALACRRHGLPMAHGRGFDALPEEERSGLEAALVGRLDGVNLRHAFGVAIDRLIAEIELVDPDLGTRLAPVLCDLSR